MLDTNTFEIFEEKKLSLINHPIYKNIHTIDDLKIFMQVHVFAVWDFMSLLKRLQNEITCTQIPWRPSSFSKKAVRFINEIVLAEESDENDDGSYCDHFSLYIKAMQEIGADESIIKKLLLSKSPTKSDLLTPKVQNFISYHINLAQNGNLIQVAASFLFGRESLLPSLFTEALDQIKKNNLNCPALKYYLQRHISLDGDHHSVLAKDLLIELCQTSEDWNQARLATFQSMQCREQLWDEALDLIMKSRGKQDHFSTPNQI